MSCAFDLDHYGALLDSVAAGGYRFASFDAEPEVGTVLLRHDVDLSLDAALQMARLEQRLGAVATYFLMTESVFYNLDSPVGERALKELRALGHRVGLHAVYPNFVRDERFDAVVAWHNPDPEYMTQPVDGADSSTRNGLVIGWLPSWAPAKYRATICSPESFTPVAPSAQPCAPHCESPIPWPHPLP